MPSILPLSRCLSAMALNSLAVLLSISALTNPCTTNGHSPESTPLSLSSFTGKWLFVLMTSHFLMTAWKYNNNRWWVLRIPFRCHMRCQHLHSQHDSAISHWRAPATLFLLTSKGVRLKSLSVGMVGPMNINAMISSSLLMLWWQGCINFLALELRRRQHCTHFMHTWRSDMHYTAIVADMWYEHFFSVQIKFWSWGGTSPSQFPFTSAFRGTLFNFNDCQACFCKHLNIFCQWLDLHISVMDHWLNGCIWRVIPDILAHNRSLLNSAAAISHVALHAKGPTHSTTFL